MAQKKPLVSVIMPVYNTPAGMLDDAVFSILSQTLEDFELILIDDCSDEATYRHLKEYTDERITIIRNEENIGITKSLNKGLDLAKGMFVARMDSDDICKPERFEKQVEYLTNNPDVIVCGTWYEVFGGKELKEYKKILQDYETVRCSFLFGNESGLCHPSAMFRKELLDRFGIRYNENIRYAQDYSMWSVCSKYGSIQNVPEVLFCYRVHDGRVSQSKKAEQMECARSVRKTLLEEMGFDTTEMCIKKHESLCDRCSWEKADSEWLNEIIMRNKSLGIYNDDALSSYGEQLIFQKKFNVANATTDIKKLFVFFVKSESKDKKMIMSTLAKRFSRRIKH